MSAIPSFTKQWHSTSYSAISPSRPELSLKGKVILITGGGTGIGAGITSSYASAGASHIAILGRRQSALDATASTVRAAHPGTTIHTYSADITSLSAVTAAFKDYTEKVGQKIDILVSNAASGEFGPSIAAVDADAWFSVVETNIKGPLHLTQSFLKFGKSDGLIVNVTSGLSYLWGPGLSAYAVSKEAGVRFFQILGMENEKLRIVNVHPGIVATDMNAKSNIAAQDDVSLPADFIVWVASKEAAFLKGKYVWVNWDVEELLKRKEEIGEKRLLEMWLQGVPFEADA